MANEGLVLDDLDLNDNAPWRILDGSFTFTPAKKKLNWATSAMSDGGALIGEEDHYDNAEISMKLRMEPQPSTTSGLTELDALTQKIQLARSVRGGLPLTWTPSGSGEAMTFYVLDGEFEEMPMDYASGWTTAQMQVVVHLYLRPFGYGAEQTVTLGMSDSFDSDSITNGSWTYGGGSGMAWNANGYLTATPGTKYLVRSALIADQTISMQFRTGTSLSAAPIGVIARFLNSTDQLQVTVGNDLMRIRKAGTTLSSVATTFLATSTVYWLQANFTGDDISAVLYASGANPIYETGLTPLASDIHTLTGGDETLLGEGIEGRSGIYANPLDANWRVNHWNLKDAPSMETSEPSFAFELGNIEGHVPAEGRLLVQEQSSQTRSHFEWGLEAKMYDPLNTWPLRIDSDSFGTSGFAGTQTATYTGAYNPTGGAFSQVNADGISETVPLTVCSTGSQFHVGSFKVKGRFRGDAGIKVRLNWRVGDAIAARNDFAPALVGLDWEEVDLGTITIPEAALGDQAWTGRIEAVGVSGGDVSLDYLLLIPTDRYGVARAPLRPITPLVYSAFDNFNQSEGSDATLGAGAPNVKTAGAGGAWTTGNLGASTADFVIDDTTHKVQRSATGQASVLNGRYAILGSTNYAGIQVQCDVGALSTPNHDLNLKQRMGIILRWVDANNWLMVTRYTKSDPGLASGTGVWTTKTLVRIDKKCPPIGGGPVETTLLGTYDEGVEPTTTRTIICQVDAAGVWQVFSFWAGNKQPAEAQLQGQDPQLATSGALQNGKIGLYDGNSATGTPTFVRTYDNFVAFSSGSDAVLYSGQSLEVRADRTERSSSTGTTYGRVPMYRGSRLFIPPTGDANRVCRMAVKARRTDVDGGLPDPNISDAISVEVTASPRYLTPAVTGGSST